MAALLMLAGMNVCNAQYPISIKQVLDPAKGGLTEKDAVAGIREALIKGTGEGVKIVSQVNGYFANPAIKIPFPQEAKDIETKLRGIGLGAQVDEVVTCSTVLRKMQQKVLNRFLSLPSTG